MGSFRGDEVGEMKKEIGDFELLIKIWLKLKVRYRIYC